VAANERAEIVLRQEAERPVAGLDRLKTFASPGRR
jgi:hypothetical protein